MTPQAGSLTSTSELPPAKLKRKLWKLCSTYFRMPHAIDRSGKPGLTFLQTPTCAHSTVSSLGLWQCNDEKSLKNSGVAPYPGLIPPVSRCHHHLHWYCRFPDAKKGSELLRLWIWLHLVWLIATAQYELDCQPGGAKTSRFEIVSCRRIALPFVGTAPSLRNLQDPTNIDEAE